MTLLEPLIQKTPLRPARLFFRGQDLDDVWAECRVNLAFSKTSSEETKQLLESALQYLRDPSVPAAERRTTLQAQAERDLARELREIGQHGASEPLFEHSHELFEQLCSEFPCVVKYRYELAVAEAALGGRQVQNAIVRLQELVDSYPTVADYRNRLAMNISNDAIGKPAIVAVKGYKQALEHLLVAIQINPENRLYRRNASITYGNLAERFAELQDHNQAASQLSNAIEQRRLVIELGSRRYDDQHALACYWKEFGVSLLFAGRIDEAERAYREGIELFRQFLDRFERRSGDLSQLGDCLNTLAILLPPSIRDVVSHESLWKGDR
jgi:tetratricopeptide (TPR) repeat protein